MRGMLSLMRFSLKWALAAMAYVALAATAYAKESTFGIDVLWTITILAFCYSLIALGVMQGESKARARGFAVLCGAYFACVYFAPHKLPSAHLMRVAGYSVTNEGRVLERATVAGIGSGVRTARGIGPVLPVANAIGTMVAGLVGCGLGALAYRRGRAD